MLMCTQKLQRQTSANQSRHLRGDLSTTEGRYRARVISTSKGEDRADGPLLLLLECNIVDEIIMIQVAGLDSILSRTVVALRRPILTVCIGELEIHYKYRQGGKVRLNHGEYAMPYCMTSTSG